MPIPDHCGITVANVFPESWKEIYLSRFRHIWNTGIHGVPFNRKPRVIPVNERKHLWGIDLGGTKIEGAVLDASKPEKVLFRSRLPTEAEKGYHHVVNQIARLVQMMEQHLGYRPRQIGIGTPGTLDPQSLLLKNSNSTVLNGQPLKTDLEKVLQMDVFMANDANCFALAETRMGVVRNKFPQAKVVFGVIMGTGVGGGIVVDGHVLNGLQGIAGEWGHNFLDDSGGVLLR